MVNDVRDAEAKAHLLAEADAAVARVKRGCDLLIGVQLIEGLTAAEREAWLAALLIEHTAKETLTSDKAQRALAAARKHNAFHWFLEFPEVFEGGDALAAPRSGFHGFVGNPPFIGGRRIRETLGDDYREALYRLYPGSSGNADYCAFFFLRAFGHLRPGGTLGLIATNTIAQGDTRLTGLDKIAAEGGSIYHATNSQPWPGTAAVFVDVVHVARGQISPPLILDGKRVQYISSQLDSRKVLGEPYQLMRNAGKSHMGTNVVGLGFMMPPEEAQALIAKDPRNANVLSPFLNGLDLNRSPTQAPSRWIINFFDWPIEKAAEYPDCMAIIRQRVYPERRENKGSYARLWWQYGRRQERLYEAIAPLKRVLIVAQTSKTLAFEFVPKGMVYSHATIIIASDAVTDFALLQSNFHTACVLKYASSLKGDAVHPNRLL